MQYSCNIYFRPSPRPQQVLPINVRSVGHRTARPDYVSINKPGPDYVEFFWCVSGSGRLTSGEKTYSLKANDTFFLLPRIQRCYRSDDSDWSFRWFTFDGPHALTTFGSLGLSPDPRRAGPCPEDRYIKLEHLMQTNTPDTEFQTGALAYHILMQAMQTGGVSPLLRQALDVIDQHFQTPFFNVDQLSRELHISRTSVLRLFKKELGISPSDCLARKRLQYAMHLLRSSGASVAEVARNCGFADPNYFSRFFSKQTGKSPAAFRDY